MHTLFSSIAASMPATAYLTLLDYWLIFGLIMPFLVFVVLVIWELMAFKLPDVDTTGEMYGTRKEKLIVRMNCFHTCLCHHLHDFCFSYLQQGRDGYFGS